MEIYIDVLFLVNLIMDFVILWIVNKISRSQSKSWKLWLGAFIGALVVCLMFFLPNFKFIYNTIGFFFLSIMMIFVAFKVKGFKHFVKLFFLLHIVAIVIGGTCIGLFYYTSVGGKVGQFILIQINNFSIKLLIFSVIVSYVTIKLFMAWYGKFIINKKSYHDIKIQFENHSVNTFGLVDTGNSLIDPFSKMPVLVVEYDEVKTLFPSEVRELFNNVQFDIDVITKISQETNLGKRLRLIPFSALGTNNGMLIGFKPDFIEVENTKSKRKVEEVIVGIANNRISKDNSYHALIHPQIIN